MSCKYFGKFKSGESEQNRLANVGESGESGTFPKKTILANSSTRQKWQFFGEYSNLLNSCASGHSLKIYQKNLFVKILKVTMCQRLYFIA
jgi:hypothetical protein